MKRLLSGITAALLALSILGTTSHVKAMTLEEAAQQVEMTNEQINIDIQRAVKQANDLVEKYQYILVDTSKLQDSQSVKDNINDVINALNVLSQYYSGTTEAKAITNNIKDLNNNLNLLKKDVTNEVVFKVNSYIYNSLYDDFNRQLDRIILNLINETNQKAEKLRNEAAKSGIIIEVEWISVNIGGRDVLIDPCRVFGF